jgi:hypothetical protein
MYFIALHPRVRLACKRLAREDLNNKTIFFFCENNKTIINKF